MCSWVHFAEFVPKAGRPTAPDLDFLRDKIIPIHSYSIEFPSN